VFSLFICGGSGIKDFEGMEMAIPPVKGNLDCVMERMEGSCCRDRKGATDARLFDSENVDLKEIVGQKR